MVSEFKKVLTASMERKYFLCHKYLIVLTIFNKLVKKCCKWLEHAIKSHSTKPSRPLTLTSHRHTPAVGRPVPSAAASAHLEEKTAHQRVAARE